MKFREVDIEVEGKLDIVKLFNLLNSGYYVSFNNDGLYYTIRDGIVGYFDTTGFIFIPSDINVSTIAIRLENKTFKILKEDIWSDNIPKKGVLCWIWDTETKHKSLLTIIKSYDPNDKQFPYTSNDGSIWKNAEPVSVDELKEFIL